MEAAFNDLVGTIYDAASVTAEWSQVGQGLCKILGAQRAYIGIPQAGGTLRSLLAPPDALDTA